MGYGIGLLILVAALVITSGVVAGLILTAIAEWCIQHDIFF